MNSGALQFIQELGGRLRPDLDLPAYPEVVRRLQAALMDDQTTIADVVRIINTEPVLAARLLHMANSAAMNPSGTPVATLNNAVSRLGFNLVRAVSMAFALRQLSRDESLEGIRGDLEEVWRASNEVASLCFAVAKQAGARQTDEALMAGLVHGMGRLYVLVHAHQDAPEVRRDPAFAGLLDTWHPVIGKAMLEAWALPPRICVAVANQDYLLNGGTAEREPLVRLLAACKLSYRLRTEEGLIDAYPQARILLNSVNVGRDAFGEVVAAAEVEMRGIQQALAA
jgi:HD-like signal output (HDOD) protein